MNSALLLSLLPDEIRGNERSLGYLSLNWLPIAGSAANIPATTQTPAGVWFIGLAQAFYATDTATPPVAQANPQFRVTGLRVGSRELLTDTLALHVGALAPQGQAAGGPAETPWYMVVPPQTVVRATLTNLTATAYNAYWTFHGIAVYDNARSDSSL